MTDLELLSAYLDNQLAPKEQTQVETRLKAEAKLQQTLTELRTIKTQLHALPTVKPPRSFTLKPEMVRARTAFNWRPLLNWSTAVAAILFAAVISMDLLRTPVVARQELAAPIAAPAPIAAQAPAPEAAMKDQQTPITVVSTRTAAAVSAVATSTALIAPSVGGAAVSGSAEAPKAAGADALTPAQQAAAPAARSTSAPTPPQQFAAPEVKTTPEPTVTVAPTAIILVPTPTATTEVNVAPVTSVAQASAASPLLWAEIILGSIVFILIALSFVARQWK